MNEYIKGMLTTRGWQDTEKIIIEEVVKLEKQDIDESMTAEEYKTVSLSNRKAAEAIRGLLNRIKLSARDISTKPKSFK